MKQRTPNATRLKAKINDFAKSNSLASQVVLQNYMFECLLKRISMSQYSKNFVLKGGLLISSIVGLNIRTTMDMDTTILHLPLEESLIRTVMNDIFALPNEDDVSFELISLESIRDNDIYGGFCVHINASYESIVTPLSVDITTGDSIYPAVTEAFFKKLFETGFIKTLAYPIENILAEKMETIRVRGTFNSRPRDFYDVHVLTSTVKYDKATFMQALLRTAEHRGTRSVVENESVERLAVIENSDDVKRQWSRYQARFPYAKAVAFEEVIASVRKLMTVNP